MADVHALAHRDCGGNLVYREEEFIPFSPGSTFGHVRKARSVCAECGEEFLVLEDYFDAAYTDADDMEWLVVRLYRGDETLTLVNEDPDVWARKTDENQIRLGDF
ncbi:hypothetical protein [Haloferax sulfurifontis]|uniref:Uncharacterized protein n=1 Tax=Haloferax sulfurifontis TaxID=255616 RepID=A0A830E4H8_9EURY|nr:hypothetical protein [Haloferax sulfurifontis]GGC49741.1 hypothetical protein GCM10007209_09240 [Haloferax sulfurifontis]